MIPLPLISEEGIPVVVRHIQVQIPVPIIVRARHPPAPSDIPRTRRRGNIREGPIPVVVVEDIREPRSQPQRSTVRHIQIEVSVVVVIPPDRPASSPRIPHTGHLRHVRERAVAVVPIEEARPERIGFQHIEIQVPIVVVVPPDRSQRRPLAVPGHPCVQRHIHERTVPLVAEQHIGLIPVRDVEIGIPVVVVIPPCPILRHSSGIPKTRRIRHIRERTVPLVAVELDRLPHRVEIQPAVVIVVHPGRADPLILDVHTRQLRHVREDPIPLVPVEDVRRPHTGHVQIRIPIIIIVPPYAAYGGPKEPHVSQGRHIREDPISLVPIEGVPPKQPGVRRIEILVPVPIVIPPGHSSSGAGLPHIGLLGNIHKHRLPHTGQTDRQLSLIRVIARYGQRPRDWVFRPRTERHRHVLAPTRRNRERGSINCERRGVGRYTLHRQILCSVVRNRQRPIGRRAHQDIPKVVDERRKRDVRPRFFRRTHSDPTQRHLHARTLGIIALDHKLPLSLAERGGRETERAPNAL